MIVVFNVIHWRYDYISEYGTIQVLLVILLVL